MSSSSSSSSSSGQQAPPAPPADAAPAAAEADVQHQAGWSFVASCSAAAGSREQFRWTGTPRQWSYWQCSIGQHRCRCSSGRSQYTCTSCTMVWPYCNRA